MYRILSLAAIAMLAIAGQVAGQEVDGTNQGASQADAANTGEVTMTPEIWRYLQQMQQYETAEQKIWRRASFQAAQRRARIASRDWYGISLSRPTASPVPHTGVYSSFWAGTYQQPSIWLGYRAYPGYILDGTQLR